MKRVIGQHKAIIKETDKTILVTLVSGPLAGKSRRFNKTTCKSLNPKRVARQAIKALRG